MFARMNVIEKAGTGIYCIKEAMRNEGLNPPVFEDMGTFFKKILFRPKGVGDISKNWKLGSSQKKFPEKVPPKLEKVPRKYWL